MANNPNSFSIPAEILQKNSKKESIQVLNEEFRSKGGRVFFNTRKNVSYVQLNHSDPDYLEDFRNRLFREIGLIIGGETTPTAKESNGEYERPELNHNYRYRGKRRGAITGSDSAKYVGIIEEALEKGATDDGMIIKDAYEKNEKPESISRLKRYLRSMVCTSKAGCPHRSNQMKFVNVMTSCMNGGTKCQFLEYDLSGFYGSWKSNRDGQYTDLSGKMATVEGKISEVREVTRGWNDTFYHLHLFDTMVSPVVDEAGTPRRNTRDIRVEIPKERMMEFDRECYFCMNDIITVTGMISFNEYFGDYWMSDVRDMKMTEREGARPIVKY